MTKKKHGHVTQAQPQQQAQDRKGEAAPPPVMPPGSTGGELSADQVARLRDEIDAFEGEAMAFPGRLAARVQHLVGIQKAAERDAGDLVRTPLHGEPEITREEIALMRQRIEMLRLAGSAAAHARGQAKGEAEQFKGLAGKAREHIALVLKALDLRYRGDIAGQKRLAAIRAGSGDADTVQDVSDVLLEAENAKEFLARCPRGEAAAVDELKKLSPELTRVLGEKMLAAGASVALRRRDIAFTLATRTERRLRAAADYWYHGTDKLADYAAFAPSSSNANGEEPAAPEPAKPPPGLSSPDPARVRNFPTPTPAQAAPCTDPPPGQAPSRSSCSSPPWLASTPVAPAPSRPAAAARRRAPRPVLEARGVHQPRARAASRARPRLVGTRGPAPGRRAPAAQQVGEAHRARPAVGGPQARQEPSRQEQVRVARRQGREGRGPQGQARAASLAAGAWLAARSSTASTVAARSTTTATAFFPGALLPALPGTPSQ